jgi:hypothetical protein
VNTDTDVREVDPSGVDMHKGGANADAREDVPLGIDGDKQGWGGVRM